MSKSPEERMVDVVLDIRQMMNGELFIEEGEWADTDGTKTPSLIERYSTFGAGVASALQNSVGRAYETGFKVRPPNTLYATEMGSSCNRELWYKIHAPELAEPITYNTRIKFLYGDMLEEMVLSLAELAGHKVEMRQHPVSYTDSATGITVRGKIDAVVDGVLVDVKSASARGYEKFKTHEVLKNDTFGYGYQLGTYRLTLDYRSAEYEDMENTHAAFIAIHRDLGHVTVDTYHCEEFPIYTHTDLAARVKELKPVMDPSIAPSRAFLDEPEGAKGNRKLGTKCAYCSFKKKCWPGVRTFAYSNGPMFLTHVESLPKVPEIT